MVQYNHLPRAPEGRDLQLREFILQVCMPLRESKVLALHSRVVLAEEVQSLRALHYNKRDMCITYSGCDIGVSLWYTLLISASSCWRPMVEQSCC